MSYGFRKIISLEHLSENPNCPKFLRFLSPLIILFSSSRIFAHAFSGDALLTLTLAIGNLSNLL